MFGKNIKDIRIMKNKTQQEVFAMFPRIVFLDNKPRMGTVRKVISRDDISEELK